MLKKILRRTLYFMIGFLLVVLYNLNIQKLIAIHTQYPLKPLTRLYIQYVARVDQNTVIGDVSPIHYAVSCYGLEKLTEENVKDLSPLIDVLIAKGVDINARDDIGITILFSSAAIHEDPIATKLLIEKKADVNAVVKAPTPQEPVDVENLTPLGFIERKKKWEMIKDPERLAQVEELLKAAGAHL